MTEAFVVSRRRGGKRRDLVIDAAELSRLYACSARPPVAEKAASDVGRPRRPAEGGRAGRTPGR